MMRMVRFWAGVLAVLAALQITPALAKGWTKADGTIRIEAAGLSFPDKAGAVALTETREFSAAGEGIDNVAQYESADGQVFATVYVYYPGLAHSGLQAIATRWAIEGQSAAVKRLASTVSEAAGVPGAAIVETYSGYRNGLATTAAFVKVGRWMVKMRASGPEARRSEVESALRLLLAGITASGEPKPLPAAPVEAPPCPPATPVEPALALPDDEGRIVTDSLVLGGVDGARSNADAGSPFPPRVRGTYCLMPAGDAATPPLLALGSAGPADPKDGAPRTVMAVLFNDAGGMIEVVHIAGSDTYRLLHQQIGATTLLGSYASVPTVDQIRAILTGADRDGGRIRSLVKLRPETEKSLDIHIVKEPAEPTT